MKKIIVIPICLYVLGIVLSAVSNEYLAFTPPFFAMVLILFMVWWRQQKTVVTDADLEKRKLVMYSFGALIIAPLFMGIILLLIRS